MFALSKCQRWTIYTLGVHVLFAVVIFLPRLWSLHRGPAAVHRKINQYAVVDCLTHPTWLANPLCRRFHCRCTENFTAGTWQASLQVHARLDYRCTSSFIAGTQQVYMQASTRQASSHVHGKLYCRCTASFIAGARLGSLQCTACFIAGVRHASLQVQGLLHCRCSASFYAGARQASVRVHGKLHCTYTASFIERTRKASLQVHGKLHCNPVKNCCPGIDVHVAGDLGRAIGVTSMKHRRIAVEMST